jgi:hypothetical protein
MPSRKEIVDKGVDKRDSGAPSADLPDRRKSLRAKWCPGRESNPHSLAGRGF